MLYQTFAYSKLQDLHTYSNPLKMPPHPHPPKKYCCNLNSSQYFTCSKMKKNKILHHHHNFCVAQDRVPGIRYILAQSPQ